MSLHLNLNLRKFLRNYLEVYKKWFNFAIGIWLIAGGTSVMFILLYAAYLMFKNSKKNRYDYGYYVCICRNGILRTRGNSLGAL